MRMHGHVNKSDFCFLNPSYAPALYNYARNVEHPADSYTSGTGLGAEVISIFYVVLLLHMRSVLGY